MATRTSQITQGGEGVGGIRERGNRNQLSGDFLRRRCLVRQEPREICRQGEKGEEEAFEELLQYRVLNNVQARELTHSKHHVGHNQDGDRQASRQGSILNDNATRCTSGQDRGQRI